MTIQNRNGERGTALLMAISLLGLFLYMGLSYFRYMELEKSGTDIMVNEARARGIAEAGLQAALGELEAAAGANALAGAAGEKTYAFPRYRVAWTGEARVSEVDPDRVARASVRVSDEAAKLNLNRIEASALARILQVDEAAAQRIAENRSAGKADADRGWFLSVDDLQSRGLLTEEEFLALDLEKLTVFPGGPSTGGPARPCFTIVSDSTVGKTLDGKEFETAHARASAVVLFGDDGGYEILHWKLEKHGGGDAG